MGKISLNIDQITKYLDITPPFLMIDRVEALVPGKSARAVKDLTGDDWFFKCHLPGELAMPGALQIEAMLQTLVLTLYTMAGHEGKLSFITNITTKLFSKVSPGKQLVIEAELLSYKRGMAKGRAVGMVNGDKVCEGEFTFISPHDLPRPRG